MGNIYVTSDLHFCHDRDFLYGPRGFDSVEEMNKEIIKRWNSVVNYDDTVYVLGDCMLNDNIEGLKCLKQLKGNIFIAIGNHDTDARISLYQNCYNVKDVQMAYRIKHNNQTYYLSHYPTIASNHDEDKPLSRRVINLCGHVHTRDRFCDMDKGLIYHCELDAHDCYPVKIEDILNDIQIETC